MRHVIIAGTEKAGTTSLFTWLAAHPDICPSKIKETNYFRGDSFNREEYIAKFFSHYSGKKLLLEASPGYLSEAEKVAGPLSNTLSEIKIIFVLRNPVERLFSSHKFHVGRLNIPETVTFDDYVDRCFLFEQGHNPSELEMGRWYLESLGHGRYGDKLPYFYRQFSPEQICVMFFDDLKADTHHFMEEICKFLGLDYGFFDNFAFRKENVSFGGQIKWLHRLALILNDRFEPFLRRHPQLKNNMLQLYKKMNEKKRPVPAMSLATRTRLEAYYLESNQKLTNYISTSPGRIAWLSGERRHGKREKT